MARSHGIVKTSIWTDEDFRVLSSSAQRAYLLLISQPQINNCGVLPYVPRRWAKMGADSNLDAVHQALEELALARFITYDEDTEEVLVRTFIRHDRIERQPNLVKAAKREFLEIESVEIRELLRSEFPQLFAESGLQRPLFAEGVPEGVSEPLTEGVREGVSARTRTRSRGHTPTAPAPSPLREGRLSNTPTPPTANAAAPANGTNLAQNGAVADAALVAYHAAARWLRNGGYLETDWRYRIDADFGVTDDIELAGLADLQEQLATAEVEA